MTQTGPSWLIQQLFLLKQIRVDTKFKNVDKKTQRALVICNPQGHIATEKTPVAQVADYELKSLIGDVIYAETKPLSPAGQEPYGVDPLDDQRTVKVAEFYFKR